MLLFGSLVKIISYYYTLEVAKEPYLPQNDNEIRNPAYQTKDIESKSLLKHGVNFDSEVSKLDFKDSNPIEQYNVPSNQKKGLNQKNFITIPSGNGAWLRLSNPSEDDKIEIVKTGFQLQAEGKLSLKKYYESTDPCSLFQFKGYSIKYESIRRTKLYKNLND